MSRLTTIEGIGPARGVRLVSHADTVPGLSKRNGTNLAAKMTEVNMARKLVRSVPSTAVVTGRVEQAKKLERKVSRS